MFKETNNFMTTSLIKDAIALVIGLVLLAIVIATSMDTAEPTKLVVDFPQFPLLIL